MVRFKIKWITHFRRLTRKGEEGRGGKRKGEELFK